MSFSLLHPKKSVTQALNDLVERLLTSAYEISKSCDCEVMSFEEYATKVRDHLKERSNEK